MAALTITDLNNGKLDLDHLQALMTSASLTATDRLGHVKMTWSGLLADLNAEAAITETGENRAAALASANAAATSEANAENYANAAASGASFYDTVALGLSGTSSGATFGVKSGGSDALPRPTLYKDNAGTAQLLYAPVPASEFDALLPTLDGAPPVWGVNDDRGNSLMEADAEGSVTVGNLIPLQLNGLDQRWRLQPASLGNFDAELIVFNNDGQSLGNGPIPAITTAKEYDNIGFAFQEAAPTAYVDLKAQNCSDSGGNLETPMFGALGYIKKLLLQENGLAYTEHNFQLLVTDNSQGSTAIAAHAKGSAYFTRAVAQATAAITIAGTEQRSVAHGGVFWTQGEADAATSLATYQAALQQLATDYNTDMKALTGQSADLKFITYQTCSITGNRNIALAQLAAANAHAQIHLACPSYQFQYNADGVHINSRSSYWMGAYYGLVYKRVAIDGVTWKPTQPVSSVRSGKIAYVTFDCMVQPLVLDTVGVPAQTNYGFTMVDSGGSALTISSITVSAPNKLKIITSTNMGANAKLRYGFGAAAAMGGFTGAAGNLRDSQGHVVPEVNGHLLHNWCAVHEFTIA